MKISKETSKKFYSKLEYNFKKGNSPIVQKLNSGVDIELTNEEVNILLKKLEYRFKKSEDSDLKLLRGL
jgi:hypothetical protein